MSRYLFPSRMYMVKAYQEVRVRATRVSLAAFDFHTVLVFSVAQHYKYKRSMTFSRCTCV